MSVLLKVEHLFAGYQDYIVKDVSLTLKAGELVGILGRNGCGKSTLLKVIMGNCPLQKGYVQVQERNCFEMNIKKRAGYLSMLTQRNNVIEGLSVREMIALGNYASSSFFSFQDDNQTITTLAKDYHIFSLLDQDYTTLSEGQKQLVQLSCLAMQNTPVFLLDEPDNALDFDNRHFIFQMIQNSIMSQQKAGLVVIHDPLFALMYCHRILLMSEGKIIDEIIPSLQTSDEITLKIQNLYPNIIIKKDQDLQQYYYFMK